MTETRKLRVFLCHASQDKSIVREMNNQLDAEGWIDPWLDEEKLLPGQDWDMEIEKAVENADAVIVFLSNFSVTKEGYIQKELRFALSVALTKPEETIFIVPLRLDNCPPPRRLQSWQYADFFPIENREKAYRRLLNSLTLRAKAIGIDLPDIVDKNRKNNTSNESVKKSELNSFTALKYTFQGHDKQVNSLAFSSKGNVLISGGGGSWGSGENQLILWDLNQLGKHNYKNIISTIWCVANSSSDNIFATGSDDCNIRIWNNKGDQLFKLKEHHSAIKYLYFLDEKRLISMDSGGTLIEWDVIGGGFIRKIVDLGGVVAFSKNIIAIGKMNGKIELWNIIEGKKITELRENTFFSLSSIIFSQDGKLLISGLSENFIEIRESISGKLIHKLEGHTGKVRSLAISLDNKLLASGADDNVVRLWNLESGEPLNSFVGHTRAVRCLAFSPNRECLVSGSNDQTIKMWKLL